MEYVVIIFAALIIVSFFFFSASLFFDGAIKMAKTKARLKRKKIITKEALRRERRAIARLRRMKRKKAYEEQKNAKCNQIPLRQRVAYLWQHSNPDSKKKKN
jgi:uncharacterized membrane protein (DUF106 family)